MAATTPEQAYRALSHHAEVIGRNNYSRGVGVTGNGRRRRYSPTQAHADVVKAMADVMAGAITPEEAMALVWRSDVWDQRYPKEAVR